MKNRIIWIIQSNQTTPVIREYLKLLAARMKEHIDLVFWVPDTSITGKDEFKELNPFIFKTTTRTAERSLKAYQAKQEALKGAKFTQGLSAADVLLLDDLGGGNAQQTTIDMDLPEGTCGIILQVPTPLGSSEAEEKIFHSAILWARQNRIPSMGYELLPLDTKWTLAPSLPDGILTRHIESYTHLKTQLSHDNIWLLPVYESAVFTSVSNNFHLNGVKACYHYKKKHMIPGDRTVLYIPHNVAMVYEYRELIRILKPVGDKIHLMFAIGKDQVRGAHSQEETIELVYEKELGWFSGYSFHDTNIPWEMMMADALIACSPCFNSQIAEKELPCIIFDPALPRVIRGNKKKVQTPKEFLEEVTALTKYRSYVQEFADTLMLLTKIGKNHD